jgi:hypothetical protein
MSMCNLFVEYAHACIILYFLSAGIAKYKTAACVLALVCNCESCNTRMLTHTRTHIHTRMLTHTRTYIHTHMHTLEHTHTRAHTCTHICTHLNTHTHTHTHTQMHVTRSAPSFWRPSLACLGWWLACCATCRACVRSGGTTAGAYESTCCY